jgi:ABC-type antimicrobial peptide transport system permease subunit
MFKNYAIVAWRNLVKHRQHAIVNLSGLTAAFASILLLFLTVHREYSIDTFHKNASQLFEVYESQHSAQGEEKGIGMPYPMAPTLKAEVHGILRATGIYWAGNIIQYKGKELELTNSTYLVDEDFFKMFSFDLITGNKQNPLSNTSQVVITESKAKALFGQEDPLGKLIRIQVDGEWKELIVSAVVRDAPSNSSLEFDVIARMELTGDFAKNKNAWNSRNHVVLVQTDARFSREAIDNEIRAVRRKYMGDYKELKERGYLPDSYGDMSALKLAPFTSIHFDQSLSLGSTANKSFLLILMLITIGILVIACFNFINLNVARAFTRSKEVGIRKTIGSTQKQIFMQMWSETFLLCLIALGLGIFVAAAVLKPFNELFSEKLSLNEMLSPTVIGILLLGVVLVSFFAGAYPAFLLSKYNPVSVIQGKLSLNRSAGLRNSLVTFQSVLSTLLIISTVVIYLQFEYLRKAPLGFVQESVISIPVKKQENARHYIQVLRSRLYNQPQVLAITGSSANVGIGMDHGISKWTSGFRYNGNPVFTQMLAVDYDFFSTLGIKPLAGRVFSPAFPADTSSAQTNVVITESLEKELHNESPVGLSFYSDSSAPKWNVIGVVPDVHFYSMYEAGSPMTFVMNNNFGLSYIMVKVKTTNPAQTLDLVWNNFKDLEPTNQIGASYLTDNTRRWYEKEQKLSSMFFAGAFLAIGLSCLGLFAIVSIVVEQKKKEIGVRKVLGAPVLGLARQLSGVFIRLTLLAFLISVPVAWYFLNQWLQNYSYHTKIFWWIFPLAGLCSTLIALVTVSFKTVKASLANPVDSLKVE